MKNLSIIILLGVFLSASVQAFEKIEVIYQRAVQTHGLGDFTTTCLEKVQFGSGQSTTFGPAINVKLSSKGVSQLQLLNGNSNAVEFHRDRGVNTRMSVEDCEQTKEKIFTYGIAEAIQVQTRNLSGDRCSVQIHSRLNLNPLGVQGGEFVNVGASSNSVLFSTFDLVEVIDMPCADIQSINDPALKNVRAQLADLVLIPEL